MCWDFYIINRLSIVSYYHSLSLSLSRTHCKPLQNSNKNKEVAIVTCYYCQEYNNRRKGEYPTAVYPFMEVNDLLLLSMCTEVS